MDLSEKVKLLESQIKNLEKIIELQDSLIIEKTGSTHIVRHSTFDYFPYHTTNPIFNLTTEIL